jgi:hypothetical protein
MANVRAIDLQLKQLGAHPPEGPEASGGRPGEAAVPSPPQTRPGASTNSALTQLNSLNTQAYRLVRANKLDEAERLRSEVVDQAKQIVDRGNPLLVWFEIDHTYLIIKQKKFEKAEEIALDAFRSLAADETMARIYAAKGLVSLYQAWDKPAQAAEWRGTLAALQALQEGNQSQTKPTQSTQPATPESKSIPP